jgi:hypothetical protein
MTNDWAKLFGGGKGGGRLPSEPASAPIVQGDDWPKDKVLLNEFVIKEKIGKMRNV